MQPYTLTYRRRLSPFKQSISNVVGHSYNSQSDKMWIRTLEGGVEIPCWSKYFLYLQADWVSYITEMEKRRIEQLAKQTQPTQEPK